MKIGFIGGSGHHYLRFCVGQPGIECAVAGDGYDPAPARSWAESFKITKWFDSAATLLKSFKPDVVSIGAVYFLNGEIAALAAERGFPVISDKPIAVSEAQLDRLCMIVVKYPKTVILTEFDFRSRPSFRAARDAVKNGLIGDVVLATAQKSYRFGTRPDWYTDREKYGGTVLWILSHSLDVIPFVTGKNIKRAIGHQGNISRPDYKSMEDHVAILMELSGGATAVAHADYLRPKEAATHGDDRLRVAGSKGVVEVIDYRCKLMTHTQGETDITDSAIVQPIQEELLAAIRGERTDLYSTQLSLERAEQLLRLRDAADKEAWTKIA